MSGRTLYLVAYDIADPKRLRQVHKTLCDHGDALQFSVFRCALTPIENKKMLHALSEIIHHREDRILIATLGPERGRGGERIQVIGRQELPPTSGPVVI